MLSFEQERKILEDLDLSPVERFCTELLSTPITFSKEITKRNDRLHLTIRSQNLTEEAGVLGVTLDRLYVFNFGSITVYLDKKDEIKFNCGDLHFTYQFKNGGSNGHFLANLHIVNEDGQYKFYSENKELK